MQYRVSGILKKMQHSLFSHAPSVFSLHCWEVIMLWMDGLASCSCSMSVLHELHLWLCLLWCCCVLLVDNLTVCSSLCVGCELWLFNLQIILIWFSDLLQPGNKISYSDVFITVHISHVMCGVDVVISQSAINQISQQNS